MIPVPDKKRYVSTRGPMELRAKGIVRDSLLRVAEAALLLRVSPRTVYLMMEANRIRFLHVAGIRGRRIPASEIDRLCSGNACLPPQAIS